jgi:hypothetical protein
LKYLRPVEKHTAYAASFSLPLTFSLNFCLIQLSICSFRSGCGSIIFIFRGCRLKGSVVWGGAIGGLGTDPKMHVMVGESAQGKKAGQLRSGKAAWWNGIMTLGHHDIRVS